MRKKIIEIVLAAILIPLVVVLVAMLISPAKATAQTSETPVMSLWEMPRDVVEILSVVALRKNATTGNLEAISGQRVSIPPVTVFDRSISVTFPGQKSSTMKLAGVRVHRTANGLGWVMPEHTVTVALTTVLVVPAGRKAKCVYEMPVARTGRLICSVI